MEMGRNGRILKIQFSYDGYYPAKALSLDDINENTLLFIRTEDGKQVYGD